MISLLHQEQKYRKSGMIHGAGSFLWPWSNQSWKDHGKDITNSEDRGKAIEASGDSVRLTRVSGNSGKEVEAGGGYTSNRFQNKARSRVLIKHSDLFGKNRTMFSNMELNIIFHTKLKAIVFPS